MACACRVRPCAPRWPPATWPRVAALLGRPYSVSGHVLHGRKLGRDARVFARSTCASRRPRLRRWASSSCASTAWPQSRCPAWPAWACGRRWTTPAACCSRCIAWTWPPALGPDGGYGRCVRVELLHKLHDERQYASLDALRAGIARESPTRRRGSRPDPADARQKRQTAPAPRPLPPACKVSGLSAAGPSRRADAAADAPVQAAVELGAPLRRQAPRRATRRRARSRLAAAAGCLRADAEPGLHVFLSPAPLMPGREREGLRSGWAASRAPDRTRPRRQPPRPMSRCPRRRRTRQSRHRLPDDRSGAPAGSARCSSMPRELPAVAALAALVVAQAGLSPQVIAIAPGRPLRPALDLVVVAVVT